MERERCSRRRTDVDPFRELGSMVIGYGVALLVMGALVAYSSEPSAEGVPSGDRAGTADGGPNDEAEPRREGSPEWACPRDEREAVVYDRDAPPPGVSLREAVGATPRSDVKVVRDDVRSARVRIADPAGRIEARLSVQRWPNGSWGVDHITFCRAWLRDLEARV